MPTLGRSVASPIVPALLTDSAPARTHLYAKWSGADWRLVSLAELATGSQDTSSEGRQMASRASLVACTRSNRSGVEAVDWAGVAHQVAMLDALRVGAGAGDPS